jgi:hypothetical protein
MQVDGRELTDYVFLSRVLEQVKALVITCLGFDNYGVSNSKGVIQSAMSRSIQISSVT